MAPGDYEIHGVSLTPGTTLSGRGASLHRLAHAPDDSALLAVAYAGTGDSLPTLIEGVTLDGRRDQQVDYRAGEGNDAHLLSLAADAGRPNRLRASIESVTLDEATGSGVFIGPESDVRLCRLRGSNLWRDIVTLRGGGSSLDVRELDASASVGTTGVGAAWRATCDRAGDAAAADALRSNRNGLRSGGCNSPRSRCSNSRRMSVTASLWPVLPPRPLLAGAVPRVVVPGAPDGHSQ